MNRSWTLWLFWLGFLMVSAAGMHWYFWKRMLKDTEMPRGLIRGAGWACVYLTLCVPFSFLMRRHLIQPLDTVVFLGLMSWLAALFYLVCLRGLAEFIPLAGALYARLKKRPFDPARRLFLLRIASAGSLSVGAIGIVRGTLSTFEDPEWREVTVKLDRLPRHAQGMTIVQLTDVHAAPWTPHAFLKRIVDRVNAARPDLIVITGDMVDGSIERVGGKLNVFSELSARYGVYFTTGNHEYYVETGPWLDLIRNMGITVLHNSGVRVADACYLAGIPDRTVGRMAGVSPGDFPDIPRAISARPPELPAILLAHQPLEIDAAAAAGADLQISGHTHGGQIWPFGAAVMAAQPYLSGLHHHGAAQIYVSRGTGTWGPPMRIAAPAELTKIILV